MAALVDGFAMYGGVSSASAILPICPTSVRKSLSKIEMLQEATDLGNADALFQLGKHYKNGDRVLQDTKKSIEWYQKAASLGSGNAIINLGICYRNGTGVKSIWAVLRSGKIKIY